MAPAKRYRVLLDGETLYSGPWRTAEIVYNCVLKAVRSIESVENVPCVILAFDL